MAHSNDLNSLLQRVSRSFYLSMQFLPKAMRTPIGLGYLWARLTDTLADTHAVPRQHRLDMLNAVKQTIEHPEWMVTPWIKDAEAFAAQVEHPGEAQLLGALASLQKVTNQLDLAYQTMIRTVMGHILAGQRSDLVFFETQTQPGSISTDQLDTYCYQVAGSVGEFWTDVGFHACRAFSTQPLEAMKQAGCKYGQGLQLVNILRDFSKDQLLGRCYLPLAQQATSQVQEQIYQQWIQTARSHLQQGLWYAKQIRPWRVRSSTILPGLLGLKTLDALQANLRVSMQRPQKISRWQVRKSMLRAMLYPRRSG